MTSKILAWLFGILLLLVSVALALELIASDQFKPSTILGIHTDQNQKQIIETQKTTNERLTDVSSRLDKIQQDVATSTPTPTTSPTGVLTFSNCVIQNGKDQAGSTATLLSNVCKLNGQIARPLNFELTNENLTYVQAQTSPAGSTLRDTDNEIFTFNGDNTTLFANAKAGDTYIVSGKVTNNNGVYLFQSISKALKQA